ncbi:MAG: glycosyltransferase family 4 protein [Armatimonadetes bacterium]|nr:glycosyltransferase family 4 protein [Armatimonadota bacterium]
MKIALLHYSSPPIVGGVESVVGTHARLLADHGHAVKVLTGRGGRLAAGVDVKVLPLLGSSHPRVLAVAKELERGDVSGRFHTLRQEIGAHLRVHLDDVDVCLVHNVLTMHKNLPLTAALHQLIGEGRRMVAWTHDLARADPHYAGRLTDAFPWSLVKTRLDVEYVAISEAVREQIASVLGVPPTAVRVIPHGLDLTAFTAWTAATRSLVAALALLAQDCVLINPVRITRRKNLELAVRVAAALKTEAWRLRLLVTGPPGPHNPTNALYVKELRHLRRDLGVEEEVAFVHELVPRCAARTMGDLYEISDAVLLTSTLEGYGLPVPEGGLFRLPVFCTDIPAFREVGGESVHYFQPDDPAERIARLIADTLDRDRAYRFRRHVRLSLTWESIYDRHVAPLLQRVGERAAGAPAVGGQVLRVG